MEHPPEFTCEATVLRLERYFLGTLARVEMLAIAEHVEACASCAHRVALLRLTVSERGARDG